MKPEVTKFRLVLDLDVVRGSRWRELAPFREAVLSHFADPALRANLAALSEALADQLLELEEEGGDLGEPWPKVHLRALVADVRHSRKGLQEVVSNLEEDDSIADRQRLIQVAAELIRGLDRDLPKIEDFLGPQPQPRPPKPPKRGRGNTRVAKAKKE
ncbi:MAG TPA: hypothetical protein VGS22_04830 [Thermoanaerobaculia bacterium]|jgi:hypothetical protein|nr:hypothetical protein [Thermoanaerobaculia bacterium]